jgi:hypothetical protein
MEAFRDFGIINFTWAIVALWMLVIGLRGVIWRKPLLVPARSGFWLMALVFGPTLLGPLRFWFDGGVEPFGIASLVVSLLLCALLLVMIWKQTSGYMVFGVGEERFRRSLQITLNNLNLPFEESLSRVRLTTLQADLHVGIQPWMGTAYLRMKQAQHSDTFRKVVDSLRKDFAGTTAQFDATMCSFYFYIVFGVLGLAASIFMF